MTAERRTAPGRREQQPWYAVALGRRSTLVALARRVVRDPSEANDIADEALARLVEAVDSDGLPADVGGWLHRTTLRLAIDRARHWVRRQRPAWLYAVGTRPPVLSPSEELERQEARELVWRAILELPPRPREVIILHEMENLSYAEVGALLEIAESTARAHAHVGREELRRKLS